MTIPHHNKTVAELERVIRRDPAQRGLIGSEGDFGPLCPGHLFQAAAHMAEHAVSVAVVTGFFIPAGTPPAAETDGPLGAVFLAAVLNRLGVDSTVLTDSHCHSAISATAIAMDFPPDRVLAVASDCDYEQLLQTGDGSSWTHLIALERVGPSHTAQSMAEQTRDVSPPHAEFDRQVPAGNRNRCHNMRGEVIDEHTADLHRLFELAAACRPDIHTIGIGDGANEIGMGSIPWEDLQRRLHGEHAGKIPCRISTKWTIVAGTSNWGGYALASAIALLRDRPLVMESYDSTQQENVLRRLVEHGPAVDGVTRLQEPTVDGLPFITFIQPLEQMRSLLGLGD